MIKFIDRAIEKLLKKILHKKRNKYIKNALDKFSEKHHPDENIIQDLTSKLNIEADRVYAIVDRSIIRERISRAKYTFWFTAIASAIVVGVIGGFTGGTALPFIAPVAAALLTWIISLATIPLSYHERITGAMDSTLIVFEETMNGKEEPTNANHSQELAQLQEILFEMNLIMLKLATENNQNEHEELKQTLLTQKAAIQHLSIWKTIPTNPPLPEDELKTIDARP